MDLRYSSGGYSPCEARAVSRACAPYDTYYTDQTVSSDCAFSGVDILARNITVTAGAVLTLRGENSVTLNAPFTVEAGAGFEMLLGAE